METLTDDTRMYGEPDLQLRLSRSHSRASHNLQRQAPGTAVAELPVAVHPEATNRHIAEKLATAGMQEMSKEHLIQRFGKRKTAKILQGKLAIEDGRVYDMSLIWACLWAHGRQTWIAAGCYCISCKISLRNLLSGGVANMGQSSSVCASPSSPA